jgi:hypothetical protein
MMGIPAEEFLVKGSLVFSLISISRPQYEGNTKLSTQSATGLEVVGMAWVM